VTAELATFGSAAYTAWFGALALSRGADLLSTWIATPRLVLEGNPIARRMGWRLGLAVNGLACVLCAFLPIAAIVISTSSLLVAARNLQSAWLMRTLGEETYRAWHTARLRETPVVLYAACLGGQSLFVGAIGAALLASSPMDSFAFAVGLGMLVYAVAVSLYSGIAVWRIRRG
jgi:hypothetical protein